MMHLVSSSFDISLKSEPTAEDAGTSDSVAVRKKERHAKVGKKNVKNGFSAEEFVNDLLNRGCDVSCDETSNAFNQQTNLPPYYDEHLYKQGQQFFHKHLFALFFSKFLGLIMLLSLDTVHLLVLTNRSSTPLTAYKRYLSTVFHMCVWYNDDFREGSKLWTSIMKVKNMHNAASRYGYKILNYKINQRDMALTQFGFMGFGLVRSTRVGIHNATQDELKGFVHLWRVVGYVLGIEDRYNICRESLRETQEICNLLIEKVFRPTLDNPPDEFKYMSKALVDGMWAMNPFLQQDVFVCYLHMTLENSSYKNLTKEDVKILDDKAKSKLNAIVLVIWALQFAPIRIFYKYLQLVSLWLMKVCPFLAYYKFGKENSHVTI